MGRFKEFDKEQDLSIHTKKPGKFVLVDLETGDCWTPALDRVMHNGKFRWQRFYGDIAVVTFGQFSARAYWQPEEDWWKNENGDGNSGQ